MKTAKVVLLRLDGRREEVRAQMDNLIDLSVHIEGLLRIYQAEMLKLRGKLDLPGVKRK